MPSKKKQGYCLTINNYTDDDVAGWLLHTETAKYAIVGFEVAPETGTPHMQCYVYWDNERHFDSMSKLFPRAYICFAKGSAKKNRKYCSKSDDFYETGELPEQGKRTDLDDVVDMLKRGATAADVKLKYPKTYLLHANKIDNFIATNTQEHCTNVYALKKSKDINVKAEVQKHFCDCRRVIYITEMSQISAYDSYDVIVYEPTFTEYMDSNYNDWAEGMPILYKYGYQWRKVIVEDLVLVVHPSSDLKWDSFSLLEDNREKYKEHYLQNIFDAKVQESVEAFESSRLEHDVIHASFHDDPEYKFLENLKSWN